MIVRLLSMLVILWGLGFAAFSVSLPGPLEGATSDAIVVPTGGPGRIDRGLELMAARQAKRMLVTGVGPGVRPRDLAAAHKTPARLFDCCVDLGREAVDTRSNAEETARWLRGHRYRTVRLVTADWHLPRARMELAAALNGDEGGGEAVILSDGVPGEPRVGTLVNEYNKLLLRRVALWLGVGG
ncbi:YdcF family protein [uncultured Sphingomonas sp.]|uniref:YdcF family protein n=1 Tax=uncultured Sphingomonas sp. TaxID=158754 RepID=UPI0035CB96B1